MVNHLARNKKATGPGGCPWLRWLAMRVDRYVVVQAPLRSARSRDLAWRVARYAGVTSIEMHAGNGAVSQSIGTSDMGSAFTIR